MKNLFRLVLVVAIFSSCGGKESYEELSAVTGMYLFDANGAAIGQWHVPNDNRRDYVAYPNPSDGVVNFIVPDRNGAQPKAMWVVPGECVANDDNDILSADIKFSVEEIQDAAVVLDLRLDSMTTNMTIGLGGLAEGFYKVFVQDENDGIYWQNIFISPGTLNFPDTSLMDESCL